MPAPVPPAPGSAAPGDLYVDLQSRALWLGVDASEDPAQAVLISDIASIAPDIAAGVGAANAYTDSQLAGKANLVHTHTSGQITDFAPAVEAVVAAIPGFNWVPGMIMMWSGDIVDIGTGDLAGWTLCDGSNGSPDLRDRFIVGAGNVPTGTINNGVAFDTAGGGSHTHTINGHALTQSQLPVHRHSKGTLVFASGLTDEAPDHTHTHTRYSSLRDDIGGGGSVNDMCRLSTTGTTSPAGKHTHTVTGVINGETGDTGTGDSHTHTETAAPNHVHNVTPSKVKAALSYYALAYIMKL